MSGSVPAHDFLHGRLDRLDDPGMIPMELIITIDTEEDQWGEYASSGASLGNIARIDRLQAIFDRYGAIPTYLVNYPVVMDEDSRRRIMRIYEDGRCGIGTHCHPWNTPPFKENLNNFNSMLCNLPSDLVHEKIRVLHVELEKRWGIRSRCFRSGRWGFGPGVGKALEALGYGIDTSITPFQDWRAYDGPDFSDAPSRPYRFHPHDIFAEAPDGTLLEVPAMIGFFQENFERCARAYKKILYSALSRYRVIGLLDRLRVLNFRWLSPEKSNAGDMIRLSRTFIRKGYAYLHMSFHSTSLLPGATPYFKTQDDVDAFLNNIEKFLIFVHESGISPAPLDHMLTHSPHRGMRAGG